jgi:hypothetical protein
VRSDPLRRWGRQNTHRVGPGGDGSLGVSREDDVRATLDRSRLGAGGRVGALLPVVQGGYYLLSGLWPLVHMDSFERVTGRKTDRWLVRTVGTLAVAIGSGLLQAGRRGEVPRELDTVARLASIGFVSVEIPTAARGRISPIYLLDAVVELGFLAANYSAARRRIAGGAEPAAMDREEAKATLDR